MVSLIENVDVNSLSFFFWYKPREDEESEDGEVERGGRGARTSAERGRNMNYDIII